MKSLRLAIASCLWFAACSPLAAQIVPPGTVPQLLDGPFNFTEGPLYDGNGGVYFTNLRRPSQQATTPSRIYRYDIAADSSTIVDANSGSANGMIFDSVGRLITCDRDRRQVSLRSLADVAIVESVLADNYLGTAFNGPNDLVMDAAGGIYFTDPDYENRNSLPDAMYYLSPAGALTQLRTYTASNDRHPNGVILSPDGKVLYLALEAGKRILAFDVGPDGSLSNDRQFARSDVSISGAPLSPPFGPDGMTIDAAGNVYAAVQNAVFAWNPAGERLFDLPVAQNPQNVEFGGDDGRTLFITAGNSLFGIELNVPSPQKGDYNGDGMVNAADYTVWRNTLGSTANLSADGNGNRMIDTGDFDEWKNHYGEVLGSGAQATYNEVPEPGAWLVVLGAVVTPLPSRRRACGAKET